MLLPLEIMRVTGAAPDVTVTVPRYDVAESWATTVVPPPPPPPPPGGRASAAGDPVAAIATAESVTALTSAAVRRRVWVMVMGGAPLGGWGVEGWDERGRQAPPAPVAASAGHQQSRANCPDRRGRGISRTVGTANRRCRIVVMLERVSVRSPPTRQRPTHAKRDRMHEKDQGAAPDESRASR